MMTLPAMMAFAAMVGITVSGVAATLLELIFGPAVSFSEPYFSPRRLFRSGCVAIVAGPLMLANDALLAYRGKDVSRLAVAGCLTTALVWATALGIVGVEAVLVLATLLF